MKEFELLDGGTIRVRATTRAGLVTASLQGLMAAAQPRTSEVDEKTERPFSFAAADFGTLLADFLTSASKSAVEHKEAYEDVRFTLITDKKAEGAYVGRPAESFKSAPKQVKAGSEVAKNEAGEWETTVTLS
ncbi:MAG TPA: hypothetical protein VL500_06370 [Candidatus Eisenbacteria bacterium]|jgi:hypothetical protein|nr:hypothetical protein [Candidatus Eisenbacteria bacterium]